MKLRHNAEQASVLRKLREGSAKGVVPTDRLLRLATMPPFGRQILQELILQSGDLKVPFAQLEACSPEFPIVLLEVLDRCWDDLDHETISRLCAQASAEVLQVDDVKYRHAVALHRTGHVEDGLTLLRELIDNNPLDWYYYYASGNACRSKGDFKAARCYYESAVNIEKGESFIFCNLGLTLIDLKKYKQAIPILIKSLMLEPDDSGCYTNLCKAYLGLGDLENAALAAEIATDLAPDNPEASDALRRVLERQSR